MTHTWLAMAAVPALSLPLLWAQDSTTNKHEGAQARKGALERVATPRAASRASGEDHFADDRAAWYGKLTATDLDQRERDFEQLLDAARDSENGRRALERWAAEGNSDFAWTCRLAQKQLERERRAAPRAGAFGGPHWQDLQSRFDDLQRQFGGMDTSFGDLQRQLEALSRMRPRGLRTPPRGAQAQHESESFSFDLEVGPSGVTCTTTENVNGKEEKHTYTAENLEALLKAHPELREHIGPGDWGFQGGPQDDPFGQSTAPHAGGSSWRFDPFGSSADGQNGAPGKLATAGQPRTDVLGVQVSKPSAETARSMGLEPELGLQVESTVPGTIAHLLGIKRGDFLIELNGTQLYGVKDVAKVLRERAPDADLVVVLIDAKGQRRSLTWKPASDATAPSAPDAPDAAAAPDASAKPSEKSKPGESAEKARRKF